VLDPLERLSRVVGSKLQKLGYSSPKPSVLAELLNTAYRATLVTEEGRFVRGSLTFADPRGPEPDPPLLRRADFPSFTPLGRRLPVSVEMVVKLARAIDSWCGSIVVYGTNRSTLFAWGVLDQMVHRNVRIHQEGAHGFEHPGVVTIVMDGIGAVSAYHGDLFLAGVRHDKLVTGEQDALHSRAVTGRILPQWSPLATRIVDAIGGSVTVPEVERRLLAEWATTIARICIGLRRAGTGGALLISPNPLPHLLDVSRPFSYGRLGHAGVLHVLDTLHMHVTRKALRDSFSNGQAPVRRVLANILAEADADDREAELTGAVRIVTSLAAVDGLVLLSPLLEVGGFGVKIRAESQVRRVYAGHDFERRGSAARLVDITSFGTRHSSMLRYCRVDRHAIGVVVSQDGQVRLIMSVGPSLTLWDNVQLLAHHKDLRHYARMRRMGRTSRRRMRAVRKPQLGYTKMPKTLLALMHLPNAGKPRKTSRPIA